MSKSFSPGGRFFLLLLVLSILFPFRAFCASALVKRSLELDRLWRNYREKDIGRQPAFTFPYMRCFRDSARRYGVPLTLLLAVARGESDFNPRSVAHNRNTGNCYGIMQIKWPGTARDLGFSKVAELYDPCRNIAAGARYLSGMLKLHKGNCHLALAAYNQGPGRVNKKIRVRNLPAAAVEYSDYIFHHLQFVLQQTPENRTPAKYSRDWKLPVITFEARHRAEGFIAYFKKRAPAVRLDWFRDRSGRSRIVLLYKNTRERDRAVASMLKFGYRVDLKDSYR